MGFPILMDQQAAASQFIQTRPYAGVFLDMSGGKSLATLHALSKIQPAGHVLIIAPIKIARLSWISEIEKWGVNVRARSLIVAKRIASSPASNDSVVTLSFLIRRHRQRSGSSTRSLSTISSHGYRPLIHAIVRRYRHPGGPSRPSSLTNPRASSRHPLNDSRLYVLPVVRSPA